jgi:lantibiotic modifying enzyme
MSRKARATLRWQLQQTLAQITAPCLELEWESFTLAMQSLGLGQGSASKLTERMFLRECPSYRLGVLFRKFPVLPRLWSLAISHWRAHIVEVLDRIRKDHAAIARLFLNDCPAGPIRNIRPGLSDPHNGGRSVTLIEFDKGRVIYKPRSGASEAVWFELLGWMNHHGFRPKMRGARVLERKCYYWMESIEPASCKNVAAVRRFYQRLGGLIAVAYLLKAVDCHRENVIAAGEHPVLVDVDPLWHVSVLTKTQSLSDVLERTGFLPNSRPRSLQSRSSVLGWTTTGNHLARISGRPAVASDYSKEIIRGFSRAWSCLVGTQRRRAVFEKKLRQIQAKPRRWIYLATERYGAILRASLTPSALRSKQMREEILTRLCSRRSPAPAVIRAEINALKQLDLPYFIRTTAESMPADSNRAPSELARTIRNAVLSASRRRSKKD